MHQSNLAVVDETVKLNDLIAVAKDETRSKGEREKAIRNLNSISPEYLGNLTLEKIGTKEATEAIDGYIVALKKKAFEEAAYNERVAIAKERLDVNQGKTIPWFTDAMAGILNNTGHSGDAKQIRENVRKEQLELLDAREKGIDDALKEYDTKDKNTTPAVDPIQNKKFWEDKKTEAQSALDALSIIDAQGEKGKALLKSIAEFDEKIEAYTNKKTKGSKAENNLLSLLKDINDAERKALQSGLEKEDSEIDRINERYDNLEKRAKELGLTPAVFTRIDNARKVETGNEKQKNEVDEYKKVLDLKKQAYDEYIEAAANVSADYAISLFKN